MGGSLAERYEISKREPENSKQQAKPNAEPSLASSRLFVSNWRTSRPRCARRSRVGEPTNEQAAGWRDWRRRGRRSIRADPRVRLESTSPLRAGSSQMGWVEEELFPPALTCSGSSGRLTGRYLRRTALIRLKVAVLAPMPRAGESTATSVNPGLWASRWDRPLAVYRGPANGLGNGAGTGLR